MQARCLMKCLFQNPIPTRASPSPLPSFSRLFSSAGLHIADDDEEDDDSLRTVSNSTTSSSAVKPLLPILLQPRVVVYDGVCHLCHRGVKWLIKADKYKKIKFCCLQSETAEPYLRATGLDRDDVLRRFLFVEGPDFFYQGSSAALKVASYLPLPYSALSVFMVVPTPLRDAVYDYVAKNRYDWFGKAEDCLVLKEKELLERFIDREEIMSRAQFDSSSG
ncbi:hypothetical protein UlMin_006923 [Ulmus minor]